MEIILWQAPLLVGAGIVMLAYLVWWVVRMVARRSAAEARPLRLVALVSRRIAIARTLALVVLSIVLFGLLVLALQAVGTSTLANLAAVASLVLEAAALRWTYLSYRATQRDRLSGDPAAGQPEQVATAGSGPVGSGPVPGSRAPAAGDEYHPDWPGGQRTG